MPTSKRKSSKITVPPVEAAAERATALRLIINLVCLANDAFFKGKKNDATAVMVGVVVQLGHAVGKPLTEAQVARQTHVPRSTVARKLEMLIKHGVITRDGKYYLIAPDRAAKLPIDLRARYAKVLLQAYEALKQKK
jgi:hypothetical protein